MSDKIGNDLIEAYKGYHEDELEQFAKINDRPVDDKVREMIQFDSPKRRLEIYLEWNGIIGWSNRIYELATGEL